MKTTLLKLITYCFSLFFLFAMIIGPLKVFAQEEEKDTVEAVQDNSSAFNDSVQFDDMEPIFYEATDDEEQPAEESSSSGIILYVGIAVVLVVVLVVLKKMGKRKS